MLIQITTNPINEQEIINYCKSPSAGAITSFFGTTRNTFEGRKVLYLEYEAYDALALKQMKAIAQKATERFNLLNAAIVHRVGRVNDTSIAVVVATEHRLDGFRATEWIMDRVKADVAIWKKEVYEDGSAWKENAPPAEG